jgi:hypothetical protein
MSGFFSAGGKAAESSGGGQIFYQKLAKRNLVEWNLALNRHRKKK